VRRDEQRGVTGATPEPVRHDGDVEIVPVNDLLRQLVLALGAALVVGNVAVLIRERRRSPEDGGPRPNRKVIAINILVGTLMAVWALGSILAAR